MNAPANASNTHTALNASAMAMTDDLVRAASRLNIGVHRLDGGSRFIDAGVASAGSLEAGVRIAEICMGGMGRVALRATDRWQGWRFEVEVVASQAVLACLGSQYAGWSLSAPVDDDSGKTYRAMGSGPARALAGKEELFASLSMQERADCAVLVLEADAAPPRALAEQIARDCGVQPERLTLIVTPTGSLAGVVQIAARVVEVALHKAHSIGFPLAMIRDGLGVTPLPPPTRDGLIAMGRTNDTILFGGDVHLIVDCEDDDAVRRFADSLPSSNSKDYGKPFAQTFKDYDYDFFQIDPLLFSPAKVAVTNSHSGNTFTAGHIDEVLLLRSFLPGASQKTG